MKKRADEKGILTKEQEKFLVSLISSMLPWSGLWAIFKNIAAKILITIVDDVFVNKLSEPVKAKLAELATACINKQWDVAQNLAAQALNDLINIPGLDEETEGLIFKGAIELIVGLIRKLIEKEKAKK